MYYLALEVHFQVYSLDLIWKQQNEKRRLSPQTEPLQLLNAHKCKILLLNYSQY